MINVALLGNPNVGKTTLYNALTGSNQYVGNWPGVTVDKKEGFFGDIKVVDLPGIYAMDTFSNEEKVSKQFLEEGDVDVILNIVDASNLNRNLYLTTQLKQFNKPIILALNMIDICENKGIIIDYKKLSKDLDVEVIPIIAGKNIGIDKIKERLQKENFNVSGDCDKFNFSSEKDAYKFIESTLRDSLKEKENNNESFTEKLDKYVLHPVFAYPIFIALMSLMFQLTFSWVGQPLSDVLDGLLNDIIIPRGHDLLSNTAPWFQSLILDGIISGVGGIIVLLPIILVLFICITLLEDSGYMARVAFMMDKLMRKMGLSGKAFIPMIIGFGCTVPAIMTARTLESEKDRKLTAILVPFMSCNARLPVYTVFAAVFFETHRGLIVASLYLMGVIVAFLLGILFKNTYFKKDEEPFIIEIPEYKMPKVSSVYKQTMDKAGQFLKKAGTIIFAMSVLVWFLSNFNINGMVSEVNESLLASIGSVIAPIFKPVGFGNWQSAVSLISGLLAKESVLASMQVIFAGDLSVILPQHFTSLSAYAFLVFILLYTPCISALGAMKKEYGIKLTLFSVVFQLIVAWVASFLVYNLGSLIF
ncbi:ferrous iron transport protein B [Clostridium saccharobutylicum]|uniref:Ferrous iron transport protein B n=1 Tax=Clostridium saccharobutylicum DSM 13864 TaxID=1345695 RepID=U5MVV3_CLOSA|nr:ferrous iron transport protein B [Clostridium saccharobutylicum]AGX43572.1 ferrous iron transport protein B [Clostridium saccharobutylicum DSM 13864]AQR90870.1 ferrous iron transport protein B [Clostridium saccharobutylicum]AQS00774.1 ferrous iron transport protein B [Clostridium saccharobutylicum]AQS14757.1 ferrous iron transport protein B [Clostridium saccharobutylicum]MBA2905978.1 ferrous iron transport protein B [Clostridium saccharobutylicum]